MNMLFAFLSSILLVGRIFAADAGIRPPAIQEEEDIPRNRVSPVVELIACVGGTVALVSPLIALNDMVPFEIVSALTPSIVNLPSRQARIALSTAGVFLGISLLSNFDNAPLSISSILQSPLKLASKLASLPIAILYEMIKFSYRVVAISIKPMICLAILVVMTLPLRWIGINAPHDFAVSVRDYAKEAVLYTVYIPFGLAQFLFVRFKQSLEIFNRH